VNTPRTKFLHYQPKTILNKGKRADHWFWTRYSAYPYLGCQHGCEFCYCREQKYIPHKDQSGEYDAEADPFAHLIKVKQNAPLLLRKALSRMPVDVIFTGDYQPAERKFRLSRQILEVCLELGFPVFILSRSPLVLRDLDLLQAIHQKARVVVAFSIISAPGSSAEPLVRQFEHLAPRAEKRFQAMRVLADAGIPTGTVAMPLLPGLCDTDENLQALVSATVAHGGSFILPSSLTLSDQQRLFFLNALKQRCPELVESYERWYPAGHSYSPSGGRPWNDIAQTLRRICQQAGLPDRIPRPIIPGEKRALNKRVVEQIAAELYNLEFTGAPQHRQWAYRRAAWAIEDLEQELGLFYRTLGRKGLESLPGVGTTMAGVVEKLLFDQLSLE
jgi:DNA repair photolyase